MFDQETLNKIFEYRDGVLYWKVSPNSTVLAGARAGWLYLGYVKVSIKDKKLRVHRIIWTMFNGEIPKGFQIDHRDGDKANNKIENLRLATSSQNNCNARKYKNNTSGFKGVRFNKQYKAWESMIHVNHIKTHLGFYEAPESAYEAYKKAAIELHGEFANFG